MVAIVVQVYFIRALDIFPLLSFISCEQLMFVYLPVTAVVKRMIYFICKLILLCCINFELYACCRKECCI